MPKVTKDYAPAKNAGNARLEFSSKARSTSYQDAKQTSPETVAAFEKQVEARLKR